MATREMRLANGKWRSIYPPPPLSPRHVFFVAPNFALFFLWCAITRREKMNPRVFFATVLFFGVE
jgi:hypothetical protein